ncbi:hypothetical protein AHAS_Ahas15G0148500 [Arachis hypogaea]
MDSQLGLHSSSTPDVTAATSSSTTVAAITTTTTVPVTTLTIGVTTSSLFPASTIATAVATSASGGASAIPVSSLQEEDDDDVHVVDPLPLVANVSQFYNNNGTLRALNPDVETTALWRSQVLLPFQVTIVLYSFLGPISTQEQSSRFLLSFHLSLNTFL